MSHCNTNKSGHLLGRQQQVPGLMNYCCPKSFPAEYQLLAVCVSKAGTFGGPWVRHTSRAKQIHHSNVDPNVHINPCGSLCRVPNKDDLCQAFLEPSALGSRNRLLSEYEIHSTAKFSRLTNGSWEGGFHLPLGCNVSLHVLAALNTIS